MTDRVENVSMIVNGRLDKGHITNDLLFRSDIAALRSEESVPRFYRQVQYPDGRIVLQDAYHWFEGWQGGFTWKEMPIIQVDEQGVPL